MAQQFSEMVGEGMCPPENCVCLFYKKNKKIIKKKLFIEKTK